MLNYLTNVKTDAKPRFMSTVYVVNFYFCYANGDCR